MGEYDFAVRETEREMRDGEEKKNDAFEFLV
jgi:hypothetical protein